MIFIKIDFYYWGDQCPYNRMIRNLLEGSGESYFIEFQDVSDDFDLAEKVKMFSPTLLIFDDTIRWNGPITKATIESIVEGKVPERKPYKIKIENEIIEGNLKELKTGTTLESWKPCVPSGDPSCCIAKRDWLEKIREEFSLPYLGLLHFYKNTCVGGAEFIPSIAVPYSIPKDRSTAFLTCSYLSYKNRDYKSYPLEVLIQNLPELGFNKLLANASEEVVFPNGTLK